MMAFLLGKDFHFISSFGKTCLAEFIGHSLDLLFTAGFCAHQTAHELPEILGKHAVYRCIETGMDGFLIGRFDKLLGHIIKALFFGKSGQRIIHHCALGFAQSHHFCHFFQRGSLRNTM